MKQAEKHDIYKYIFNIYISCDMTRSPCFKAFMFSTQVERIDSAYRSTLSVQSSLAHSSETAFVEQEMRGLLHVISCARQTRRHLELYSVLQIAGFFVCSECFVR